MPVPANVSEGRCSIAGAHLWMFSLASPSVMLTGSTSSESRLLAIMQEARDLSLQLSRLREVCEGSRVFEEFPLDFGRERTPSYDDRGSQTFQNFCSSARAGSTFRAGTPTIRLDRPFFDTFASVLFGKDFAAPPSSSHRAIAVASCWLASA